MSIIAAPHELVGLAEALRRRSRREGKGAETGQPEGEREGRAGPHAHLRTTSLAFAASSWSFSE